MPVFRYKAVDNAGEIIFGEIDADSERAVVSHLHSLSLLPIRVSLRKSGLGNLLSIDLLPRRRGLRPRVVMMLTRELSTLLEAGIELERALTILQTLAEKEDALRVLSLILDAVRSGKTLADALAMEPDSFSKFYISMVQAGEAGGALESVFNRLAIHLENVEAAKDNVKSALIYPMILLSTAALSLIALVGFVLPRFRPLFESAGRELPVVTRIVMDVGSFMEEYWWAILLALLTMLLSLRLILQAPSARLRWDSVLLRVPIVGELIKRAETAHIARTLGTLLTNGVPVVSALEIARDTIGNSAFLANFSALPDAVKAGRSLSDELLRSDIFPQLAQQMIRVGEESGRLEGMLLKTAEIYDQEVRRGVHRALALLTPTTTVVLGLFIAGIISSILVAILSINDLAL